ncbi:MAG: thiamine phosphate synthase [Myxococcota bacterium]
MRAASLPRLVVITDWSLGREVLLARLEAVLEASPAVAVQHRHPGATARALFEEARVLQALTQRRGNALFINGRLDIALLVGAHLHLPADGPSPAEARAHLGERWLSAAVHDEAEAQATKGADFALVSPVFSPGSKPGDTRSTLGVEGFLKLRARLECPAYALGGIDATNVFGGADGAAAISGILSASDPAAAARAILAKLSPPPP